MRSVTRRPTAPVVLVLALLAGLAVGCTAPAEPAVTGSPTSAAGATASPTPEFGARAAELAKGMSDVELVGQVLMPSVSPGDAGAAAMVKTYRVGSVILMGDVQNTQAGSAAAQVRAFTDGLRGAADEAGAKAGLMVATDQEYGWVTRIRSGVVQLPAAMAFGAAARADLTEQAWRGAGTELAAAGIDIDFAPDADVVSSPGNTIIGSRSYGSDPSAVAAQVAAAVRGLQASGVAATVKHFPGHGHTTVDSHSALPVLSQSLAALQRDDLPPFQAGIGADVWLVMAGHLDVRSIDPGVAATFSHKVLTNLLRTQLRFGGVAVTDALNMAPARRYAPGEAAVRAMLAGADLLLMPPDLAAARDGLLGALSSGRLSRERLLEAVTRILTLNLRLAAFHRPDISTVEASAAQSVAHTDAARAVAAAAVTVVRGACGGALVGRQVRVTASAGTTRARAAAWLADALTARGYEVVSTGGDRVHLVGYGDSTADLAAGAALTVAMDSPFLLAKATSPVLVATYSDTQVAMQSLAAALTGEAGAPGRSPVAVTGLPRSACAA